MYIACPKCETSFSVLPEQIGPFGRKVKCSKCSHIWHQMLNEHTRLEPVMSSVKIGVATTNSVPFGKGINLPALLPIKIPQYLYALPFLFTTIIILLSLILFQEFFGINSVINNAGLTIKDVQIENKKDSDKLLVSYKIMNSSEQNIAMPLVRVRLFDKKHRMLKSHVADQSNVALAPKQYVAIKTEFTSVPAETEQIDVTLGNRLDFMLR